MEVCYLRSDGKEVIVELVSRLIKYKGKEAIQTLSFDNEKIIEAYYESIGRIKSIAVVHDEMYQAEDLNKIHFYKDIEVIARYVSNQFQNIEVNFEFNLDEIDLNVNQAVLSALF